MTWCSY